MVRETVFLAVYPRGGRGLRAELTDALRTGRVRRRRKGPSPGRGARRNVRDIALISERPGETAERALPVHGEGDLILCRGVKSEVATNVERLTRFTLLLPLPTNRKIDAVQTQLCRKSLSSPNSCGARSGPGQGDGRTGGLQVRDHRRVFLRPALTPAANLLTTVGD